MKLNLSSQPLDKACFPTTHNSFNVAKGKKHFIFPNHTFPISKQLTDSIRGFMLDVYEQHGEVYLYHSFSILGKQKLSIVLTDMKIWMENHPNEVIAIIFQNAISRERILEEFTKLNLQEKLASIDWNSQLPTLQDLAQRKQQIIAFVESNEPDSLIPIYGAWRHIMDTPWKIKPHDKLPNRIGRGKPGNPLFLVNHWIDRLIPEKRDAQKFNEFNFLKNRILQCKQELGRWPNFIGVNFHEKGDVVKVCQWVQYQMLTNNIQ
ncbi:MAG: hypothetical protein K1X82_11025 [Bacteroidia bacterium]|nr:hypothetical protein [Bacteroidia bacterium]